MQSDLIMAVTIFFEGVALATMVAYLLFNKRWRRRERARFVIGVMAVLFPAILIAAFGFFDFLTAAIILAGFIVAGGLTMLLDIESETQLSAIFREGFDAESDQ